jgi:hypothetical protein
MQLKSQAGKAADAVQDAISALPSAGRDAAGKFTSGAARKELASAASDVLDKPVDISGLSKFSPYTLIASLMHPHSLGAIAGGNALATKTIQRAAMGDTAAQKVMSDLIAAHPEAADLINSTIKNYATTQSGVQDVSQ